MRTQPLFDELEAALGSGSETRRVEMLVRIADLFSEGASRYSENQISLFDDVMTRLLGTVEESARAKLALRLAAIPNAPGNVIRVLAFDDDIEVARPILSQSERINDAELLAAGKSQQHLYAVAQRKTLSEALTEALIERGDRHVVQTLIRNPGAHFSDAGLRMLVTRATGDAMLTMEMGTRSDIRQRLLEKVSSAEHQRLCATKADANVLESAATQVGGSPRGASPDFATAKTEVERQNRIRPIGDAEIYQYARDRRFTETAAGLSLLCDTPIEVVERALLDPGAELVLILAKVAGLSSSTARAILLLRATDRGVSADNIERALENFDQLRPEAAKRVLSFFRTRAKKPAETRTPPALAANG
jgi:uncharacterized protein (DUF2336 family)